MHPLLIPAIVSLLMLPQGPYRPKLNEVRLEYGLFSDRDRDPLLAPNGFKMHEAVNLGIDFTLVRHLHWQNTVMAVTDPGQYRSVAWDFRIFVAPVPAVEIGFHHQSRHLLDTAGLYRFPVQDAIEARWYLYRDR